MEISDTVNMLVVWLTCWRRGRFIPTYAQSVAGAFEDDMTQETK